MPRAFRRFEILLPQRFNDGRLVPSSHFANTLHELKERFGGVSAETQEIRGFSLYSGQAFNDELIRLYVDVPDTPENLQFFQNFKEQLKANFQQVDIWLITHAVEVL
jgi:hypothetical protein